MDPVIFSMESVIPEKESMVPADDDRLLDIRFRFAIRFDTMDSASFTSVIFATDSMTVSAVSATVDMNIWFIWFWMADAPFSVTFGAMALSLALQ